METERRENRPAAIEITPEMLEAGEAELYQDDICETRQKWAARMFRAMISVAKSTG
jgi:hypothetical protein